MSHTARVREQRFHLIYRDISWAIPRHSKLLRFASTPCLGRRTDDVAEFVEEQLANHGHDLVHRVPQAVKIVRRRQAASQTPQLAQGQLA